MLERARAFLTRIGFLAAWGTLLAGSITIFISATASAATGLEYLSAAINADGSYGNSPTSLATPVQSTAEVLRAYQALSSTNLPSYPLALAYLAGSGEANTEYLSRKIVVAGANGQDTQTLVAELLFNQDPLSGGFGNDVDTPATVVDTAFAVAALYSAGLGSGERAAYAVGYLLQRQRPNGGWLDGDNQESAYLTALVVSGLGPYRYLYQGVSGALTAGQSFLLNARNGDAWGENFLTAIALATVAPNLSDLTPVSASVTALEAAQLPDGSWDNDPFTTALALQALHLIAQPRPDFTLGAVGGRVTDSVNGLPISGAAVSVTGADSYSGVTDSDGRYLISGVKEGSVNVTATAGGYLAASAIGTVAAGRTLDFSPRLGRDPTPTAITLQGLVVDGASGSPLAGATVRVAGFSDTVLTGSDGRFVLGGIPAGTAQAEVSLSGFLTTAYAISAPSGGSVDLGTVRLYASPQGSTGVVQGTVVDALSNEPLRNVIVGLSGSANASTVTDLNGQFVLNGIAPGDISLSASLDGYQTATASGSVVSGSTLSFAVRLVKAENPGQVTVTGNVIDSDTRLPLTGATVVVSVNGLAHSSGVSSDGSFSMGGLPAGPITAVVSHTGYSSVAYSVSVPYGGLVALGQIVLSPDVPVSGNRNPVINSRAPTQATAGRVYAYNVTATDPDGDATTFALSDQPSGMSINATNGQIRWIPTYAQVGTQTFTVVVFDTQGGRAQEVVTLNVTAGGSRSYVITDVQTLSGVYIDGMVPNNYSLGTYISGGSPSFVSGSPPCPLTWYNAGSNVSAALNALERLSATNSLAGQPAPGRDIIVDLAQSYSSATVFPQIDHGPFPQEGIEYTVWGADDPNAAFPDGWTLATLVAIYRQGYVETASCVNQDETDDYAGLYTFGLNSFRYLRVRADYSITIFNTPDHSTWNGSGDDSGEPGWQSLEAEIDAVGGMICDVKPVADAGADIIGLTGEALQFDASGSQGSILVYGWDLDGDNAIDLTGVRPTHVFASDFDRDVTLMVVDNRGCVGTDTVRVTVALNLPKPDLTVTAVGTGAMTTDLQTLRVGGNVHITIQNIGRAAALQPALVAVFEDTNGNGVFDEGSDNRLGALTMPAGLARGASLGMDIPLNGTVSFRDSPLYAMVDSDRAIEEEREDNNVESSAQVCRVEPPVGTFVPTLKWHWSREKVLTVPLVAPLSDTNNDGRIDRNDETAVIFASHTSFVDHSTAILRAVNGRTGADLWAVTDPALLTEGSAHPAVGDIDGDGLPEIVMYLFNGGVAAINHDGSPKWATTVPARPGYYNYGAITLADLDGDGRSEILARNHVLNYDGTLRWSAPEVWHAAYAIAADLDLDGAPEVIIGSAAYRANGQPFWTNVSPTQGFTAIGNFDADPYPELAITGGGYVSLYDQDGSQLWRVAVPGGGGGAPTIADTDGDGHAEIGVAGRSNYAVFNHDGSLLWASPTQDFSSQVTGSTVFDFDGDGDAEIVYADERFLRVYNGQTGAVLFSIANSSATATEYPVVADIDGDDHAEILVGSDGGAYGLRAFQDQNDSWVATRRIWNQHAYHITNVNEDASIPAVEQNSWQTHNTYRLNTFPDRHPLLQPDLSIAALRVALGSNPSDPATITVRVGNAGAGPSPASTVSFYEGDPTAGGILLGTTTVAALQAGSFTDVSINSAASLSGTANIYAVVDPQNRIAECRESNNTTFGPVTILSLSGDIAVATDAPVYGPQSPVALSATITNPTVMPAIYRATLTVEDAAGNVLATFGPRETGTLAGGADIVVTEAWHTGAYLAGNYQLRGRLYSVDNGLLDEAVATFEIRHDTANTPAVTLRTTTDRPVYHTTDLVNIQSLVGNITANALVDNAVLAITIKDPAGQTIFFEEGPLGQLPPGSLRDLLLPYYLDAAPIAVYRVEGTVLDAATRAQLASATTQYEVVSDLNKSLTGSIDLAHTSLEIGTTQTCAHNVGNAGTIAVSALEVHYLLVNIDTEQQVSEAGELLDLAAGASNAAVRTLGTSGLAAGNYACVTQAYVDGSFKTLAYAPFKLTVPPIRIDAEMQIGAKGRLLVLLDDSNHCEEHEASGAGVKSVSTKSADSRSGDSDSGTGDSCDKDRDPHGPDLPPTLSAQRSFLEPLLKAAGWSYTITETAEAFTREMRTGGYTVYALLGEQNKLAEDVQKELREAIFRGEGLVMAGSHDSRNNNLNDALGIKRIGAVAEAQSVVVPDGPLTVTGTVDLIAGDKAVRIKRTTATALATYRLGSTAIMTGSDDDCRDEDRMSLGTARSGSQPGGDHDECEGQPDAYLDAITRNDYGRGRSVFAGFDLLATAARDGDASLAAKLLLNALTLVQPALHPAVGGVLPIDIVLTNQGVATPARITVTLPAGTQVIDAGDAQQQPGPNPQETTLVWLSELALAEEERHTFYLRLPDVATSLILQAVVEAPVGAKYNVFASPVLTLSTAPVDALDDIVTDLRALIPGHPEGTALRLAAQDLERAIRSQTIERAVSDALRATDRLLGITQPEVTALRVRIDEWIRYTARQLAIRDNHH